MVVLHPFSVSRPGTALLPNAASGSGSGGQKGLNHGVGRTGEEDKVNKNALTV